MAPSVIPDFVTTLGDLCGTIGMGKSGNKESAIDVCVRQRGDQIVKTFCLGSAVEGESDFVFAARPAVDFTSQSNIFRSSDAACVIRFEMTGV
jgi:hypothetical protein